MINNGGLSLYIGGIEMSANTAVNHYMGKEGYRRLNCAQSVIYAFKEKFGISPDIIESFVAFGGGRAPDGLCGAFFAARYILEKHAAGGEPSELDEYFAEQAGALKCREIRMCRMLSCIGCVEKSAEFLEKYAP